MHQCDCCYQESSVLVEVENRDPTSSQEYDRVCPTCAELISWACDALWHRPLFTAYQKRGRVTREHVSVVVA